MKAEKLKECDCCFMCGTRGAVKAAPDEPKLHTGKCRTAWQKFAGKLSEGP